MSEERILVGAFTGSFGVRGEARLKSFCAEPEAIGTYSPLWSEDGTRRFSIRITRSVPNGFAARVEGISTKEQADDLRGVQLFADRDKLPSLPDDEFYHADLIGLPVFDTGGGNLGRVKAVLNHGAGDILEIAQKGQRTPLLLPFTRAAVPTVDLTRGRIVADPPADAEDPDADR